MQRLSSFLKVKVLLSPFVVALVIAGCGSDNESDNNSDSCAEGTWDDDSSPETTCIAHTECIGTTLVSSGTATSDTECGGVLGAIKVGVGDVHSCALLEDGSVRCWGSGKLGDGATTTRSTIPVVVEGIVGATDLTVSGNHSCVVLADGTAKCWGRNSVGQLGIGVWTDQSVPIAVSTLSSADAIAAGNSNTCVVLASGSMKCWGKNTSNIVDSDPTPLDSNVPVTIPGLDDVTEVSVSEGRACALLGDKTVSCWGTRHQLESSVVPTVKLGLNGVEDISVGGQFTCVAMEDGSVMYWGKALNTTVPLAVVGLTDIVSVVTAQTFGCGVRNDGTVSCWGKLGFGNTDLLLPPTEIPQLSGVVSMAAWGAHACAVQSNGVVKCWGNNRYGQLGSDSPINQVTPVEVVWE